MSTAKGPGKRQPSQPQFEEDAEIWEYYNPALALVDNLDLVRTAGDVETVMAHETGGGAGRDDSER